MIKDKEFFRSNPNKKGWTIGYDFNNGALLQFTKTSYTPGYKIISSKIFYYAHATQNIEGKKYRIWINIGGKGMVKLIRKIKSFFRVK